VTVVRVTKLVALQDQSFEGSRRTQFEAGLRGVVRLELLGDVVLVHGSRPEDTLGVPLVRTAEVRFDCREVTEPETPRAKLVVEAREEAKRGHRR
jgi:hypothetical protein